MRFLEDFGQKKCTFWSKRVFLGQEDHYNMVDIAYHTELNLQICNYAQNDAFVAKVANIRQMKSFVAIYAFAERLPTSATL